ncbi:MAG: hypothetical protein HYR56_30205 [Acidobacteria bacterium]|nr:hypothetical protein [Acidobacteriota bacterium]MBI3423692.1 hypothetical protein [Acidobacteriota bacterium]
MILARPTRWLFFAGWLWLVPHALLGQTPPAENPKKEPPRQLQTEHALVLLEECLAELSALRLTENRIALQINLTEALWPRAATRAQALASQAVAQLLEFAQQSPAPDDPMRWQHANLVNQLSGQLFQVLAEHDVKLALELLRALRATQPLAPDNPQGRDYELQLAAHLAPQDPQLALQTALEGLKDGNFSHQLLAVWHALRSKDPQLAEQFLNKLLEELQRANWLTNSNAINLLNNLLNTLNSEVQNAAAQPNSAPSANQAGVETARQQLRQLLELLLTQALKLNNGNLYDEQQNGSARYLLGQLRQMLPLFEKHLPARLAAARAKLAQFEQAVPRYRDPYQTYQPEKQTAAELTALAAKAPPQERTWLYTEAANKSLAKGELERARQIINDNISDPQQRHEALTNLNRQLIAQLTTQEKFAEAQTLLQRLPISERISYLTQWAAQAVEKNAQPAAQKLLAEARALLGDRLETRAQMEAQAAIAQVYARLEAERAFELLEPVMARGNQVLAAYATLGPYDQNGLYRDGESLLVNGIGQGLPHNLGAVLALLASQHFDRVRNLLNQCEAPEVRLQLKLTLAVQMLAENSGNEITLRRSIRAIRIH